MNPKTLPRRRHSAQLKAQVLRECESPGASVAAIALAHGLNANLVHKWRRLAQRASPAVTPPAQFIALPLAAAMAPSSQPQVDIHIELRRGALMANITWPTSAAQDCSAWLRELLR